MTLALLLLQLLSYFALPQTASDPCGCEDKPEVNILAVIDGVKITKKELGSDTQNKISELQNEVIKARSAELDLLINSYLLEAEAKRRGQTAAELLQTDVINKVTQPTDTEAEVFYNQRKDKLTEDFKTLKPEIIEYLRAERQRVEAQKFAAMLRAAANVKILVQDVTPPAGEQDLNRVLATVGGRQFTARDIEESLKPLIYQVQQQVYQLRKNDVDRRINDALLEQEAKRQNITPETLLSRNVRAKTPIITDQQAKEFYDQNKARINGKFEEVKMSIVQYLTTTEQEKLTTAFAEELRKNAAIQFYLTPPESPTFKISVDDQPMRGNAKAAVTVVQFTDFQCPSCASQHAEFDKLVTEFGQRVNFVVRDYPLNQHADAFIAAEAAEAAREQGKYWEFTSLLYDHQSALSVADLKRYATQLGLDRAKFDAAVDSRKFRARVQRDIDDAEKLGVQGTPTFFVNGKKVSDISYSALKTAIENALKRTVQ
jgi:protein-disulfide isomerase